MADFLLEIGTEEIPARMMTAHRRTGSARRANCSTRERLASESAGSKAYSTPRRLAVLAPESLRATRRRGAAHGPSLKVAYKDGEPTPAAEAFARKAGISGRALEKITTPKGEYLAATVRRRAAPPAKSLPSRCPRKSPESTGRRTCIGAASKPERFVRPVRWLVALLDGEVVPVEFAGINAGKRQRRPSHPLAPAPVEIDPAPRNYVDSTWSGIVIPTSAAREQRIRKALDAATRTIPGARWREDKPCSTRS